MSMKWWTASSSQAKKKSGMRRAAGILAAIALSTAVAGCSLLPDEPEEEDLSQIQLPEISKKPEYEVTTKTLETTVSGSGKILSTQEKTLYYSAKAMEGMRLKKLYIQPGDVVKAGQTIAELDVEDMKKQLRDQRLQFRQQELQMKQTLRDKDEMDPIEFEQKQIAFEEARQKISDLETDIGSAVLTAPFAGTVVSVNVQEGAAIKVYDPLCVIANPSSLIVAGEMSSDDLQQVAVGMEATVDINSAGAVKGKIKSLPVPKAEGGGGGGGAQGPKVTNLSDYLLISVAKLPAGATRGTPLSFSIVVDRKVDAVVIPRSTLHTAGARTYVQVADADGSKREVDIEVGQQTATDIEVLSGLTPGQKVVGS
ncbi:efflux RND transporter periplasmic adaptor subunit [Cohnella hashimotonis]|uniref:Efflux RND transporter periplasmic adaptor subunit n=1 Tax=Cohnella hashimotonis TaxID=2826895 RepID=A0ABT6TI65_9BACL|nr:HlyD family efflux transporter periplasmic adaptor subunit [Cohnella hashimotonis]MDI4646517.1 efflux RND transporter periplasmic adaptor subunit [Cohnella hashimotonis]